MGLRIKKLIIGAKLAKKTASITANKYQVVDVFPYGPEDIYRLVEMVSGGTYFNCTLQEINEQYIVTRQSFGGIYG